ncbi:hypothetical protein LEP1GSC132_4456 [Leptospira kirschneri str. 200803703]|uniref:Uncharacterized protein n=1 Tax=Leptospira kirschneri str. 200802841 TaxID=1193047 RepID=A0A828Y354_9LEPT|nr:hypothetical protein [Leptospira kirschneri]EKO51318.1 hypothetical protein LEP1GSC131_2125 [Leptospira kirschneri str. 200802841]EMO68437.1 hypothetical protein LEP1GSC132_4456 [Leptospira kirschneri str. 200803703]EMO76150.1 hypothetical protein LEP1GSC127_3463 [Leptospira kirschneri str. 200801925]EMO77405.1 hypothetical protein LEP1GSC127_2398 [Leptospira kirschneri str. 200801925]
MNYILDKSNKKVVWINADSNQMSGIDAWANFNPNQHEIVYSLHYNPEIGETFLAEIKDGIAQDFIPQKVYNKISKEERILQSWEDRINPETETDLEPLKNEDGSLLPFQIYAETEGWIVDLIQKKDSLIKLVNSICESKIIAGFVSNALGASHFYSSDRDDQLNLVGLVSLNIPVLYKCTDKDGGAKEYRNHSANQIKQVLGDGAIRKTLLLQKAASLKVVIQSIETVNELDNVNITSGWD